MAIVITLIAISTSSSLVLIARSKPNMDCLDSLINTINSGMITGKLRIDMIVLLFPVLALIAETMVKTEEKLSAPSNTAVK